MLKIRAFNPETKNWRWITIPGPNDANPGAPLVANLEENATEWAQGWRDDGYGNIEFLDGDGDLRTTIGGGSITFFDSSGEETIMEIAGSSVTIYKDGGLTIINPPVGITLAIGGGAIYMPNLPTANPNAAGQLWNDGGTLKVSSG